MQFPVVETEEKEELTPREELERAIEGMMFALFICCALLAKDVALRTLPPDYSPPANAVLDR